MIPFFLFHQKHLLSLSHKSSSLQPFYPCHKTILSAYQYFKSINTTYGTIILYKNIDEIYTFDYNTYLHLTINGECAQFTGYITIDCSSGSSSDIPFIIWNNMRCLKVTNRPNFILNNKCLIYFYKSYLVMNKMILRPTILLL